MQISNIKERAPIDEVVEWLTGEELSSIGQDTLEFDKGNCPFCGHNGCFRINIKESPGYWKCFSCGKGGDAIDFFKLVENVGTADALRALTEKFGCGADSDSGFRVEKAFERDSEIVKFDSNRGEIFLAAAEHYQAVLNDDHRAIEYQTTERGHRRTTLDQFRVGFSDGGLVKRLMMEGHAYEDLAAASMINKRGGDFLPAGTYIYPHLMEDGSIGRFTFKDPQKRIAFQLPLSVSNPGCKFYGQNTLSGFPERVLLVEGENDLLSAVDIGWTDGVLASNGQLSSSQTSFLIELERRYREAGKEPPTFITLFDGDEAGEKYRVKVAAAALSKLTQVQLPASRDIDDLVRAGRIQSVNDLMTFMQSSLWKPATDYVEHGIPDDQVSEMDQARRLLVHLDGRGRYLLDQESWMYWDGSRWIMSASMAIKHEVKEVAAYWRKKALLYWQNADGDDDQSKAARKAAGLCSKAADTLLSRRGMDNVVHLAATDPQVQCRTSDLNRDPQTIGLHNGIYNLDRMALLPPDKRQLITRQLPFSYDKDAQCPNWIQFIRDTVRAAEWSELGRTLSAAEAQEDARQMESFLQEVAGLCLSGKSNVKGFFYVMGKKDTGKSVYTNLLLSMMGEYGRSITPQALMMSSMQGGDVKAPEIAELDAVRLAVASEAPEGARLNEDLIKRLTGADPITARKNYGNPITFMPQMTLMFSANERPSLTSVSQAFWERMMVVPFLNRVPSDRQDKALPDKLKQELPGIFLWCLEGWRRFSQRGRLEIPERVKAYSSSLQSGQDMLAEFLDETIARESSAFVDADGLYLLYRHFMHEAGMPSLGRARFVGKLQDMGITRVKKRFGNDPNPRHYYAMIALKDDMRLLDGRTVCTYR